MEESNFDDEHIQNSIPLFKRVESDQQNVGNETLNDVQPVAIATNVNETHTIVEDTLTLAEVFELSIDMITAGALQLKSSNTALPPLPFKSTEISISTGLANAANDLRNIGLEQSKIKKP